MQRLRNVKQLGLVPYVFPGADFSRLGHSLGVSHVTAMILDSLRRQGEKVPDPDYRDYRLAAFLHDIGHYPFSHTTEHALETFYGSPTSSAVEPVSGPKPKSKHVGDYYNHEHLGSDMLETDDEIKRIFGSARPKVDPNASAH